VKKVSLELILISLVISPISRYKIDLPGPGFYPKETDEKILNKKLNKIIIDAKDLVDGRKRYGLWGK
jgi:hypothetical protein